MDCLTELDIYRLDFSALNSFFEKSDLIRKLNGFIRSNDTNVRTKSTLYALRDFLRILSLNPVDGKLLMHFNSESISTPKLSQCELEYISLNPAVHLNRMLDQVGKMVLMSGTLEPAGDFALLNPCGTTPWKFSCGHVVPDENF